MHVRTIIKIETDYVEGTDFIVTICVKDKNDIPKLSDFENNSIIHVKPKEIRGYVGDMLFATDSEYLSYYDTTHSKWCRAHGKSNTGDIWVGYLGCIILNIPKNIKYPNISSYAIYCHHQLYAWDQKTCNVIKLTLIDAVSGKTETQRAGSSNSLNHTMYGNKMFYIYDGILYEFEWCYDKEFTFSRRKHLPFIYYLDNIYNCGKYGILLRFKENKEALNNFIHDETVYFGCYEPNQQIIYRLTKDDLKNRFEKSKQDIELDENEEINWCEHFFQHTTHAIWFNETQNMILCHDRYIYSLSHAILCKMQSKAVLDCYDVKAEQYDVSFKQYESRYPQNIAEKGFLIHKTYKDSGGHHDIGNHHTAGRSRVDYLYHCAKTANCYEIVAGYNIEPQKHYQQLQQLLSKEYKKLDKLEDLADYLGGPIWYQLERDESLHIIQTATMVEFGKELRSSKQIQTIKNSYDSTLGECKWIGVLDICDETKSLLNDKIYDLFSDEKITKASFDLKCDELETNYFEITSGRIICADYSGGYFDTVEFGNVMKGTWYFKLHKGRQLVAYHESVKNNNEYMNWRDISEDMFDECKEDPDICDLDEIRDAEKEIIELKKVLNCIEMVEIMLDEAVIQEICDYCYYVKTLNWVHKTVLNGNWLLHRTKINGANKFGIFDIDCFRNEKYSKDPFQNKTQYDWFLFNEGKVFSDVTDNLWEEMVRQSLEQQNPCSVKFGCAVNNEDLYEKYPCLAKLNQTKQVVCIRAIFVQKSDCV